MIVVVKEAGLVAIEGAELREVELRASEMRRRCGSTGGEDAWDLISVRINACTSVWHAARRLHDHIAGASSNKRAGDKLHTAASSLS